MGAGIPNLQAFVPSNGAFGGRVVSALGGGTLASNATAFALQTAAETGLTIFRLVDGDGVAEEASWTLAPVREDAQYGLPALAGYARAEQDESSHSATIVESGGFGAQRMITVPRSRGADRRVVQGLWPLRRAEGQTEDTLKRAVEDVLAKLRSHLPNRSRPPVLQWTYGSRTMRCWLADYSISVPHGLDIETGHLRAVRVTLNLVEANGARLTQVARAPFERETTWVTFAPGDTWEMLAQRYLDDPIRGVLLRRINPDVTLPTPDARVRIFDRTHSRMRGEVAPRSPGWIGTGTFARWETMARARLVAGGEVWDSLPASLTTVPDGEPTANDAGTTAGGKPAWRAPIERQRDAAAAIARGEVTA